MKKPTRYTFLIPLLAAVLPAAAIAMTASQIPGKFNIPWGNSATPPYIRSIPQNSQIGIQNCAASLTDGFPPLAFVPVSAGGCPPFGSDFNGVLQQITKWSQWQSAGGPVFWDSAFSTAVGGYPKGAILQSSVLPGRLWFSIADNNITNPDASTAANWTVLPGTNTAGTPIPQLSTTAPPNAVPANGLTVGNAISNATNRANADTFWLFSYLWTNCSGCQLYNSAGGAISRGSTAAADFAANDAVATNNMNGSALIGADSMAGTSTTFLSGVPVVSGSRTVPGSILGENLHSLSASEIPTITALNGAFGVVVATVVSVNQGFAVDTTGGGSFAFNFPTANSGVTSTGTVSANSFVTTSNNTGNGAHNTVDRSTIVYWFLAL